MSNVEPLPVKRVRKGRKPAHHDAQLALEGITMGEVVRRLVNVETAQKDVGTKVDRLMGRFTLFFGLGIGAMAASGLISDGAKELILKIVSGI